MVRNQQVAGGDHAIAFRLTLGGSLAGSVAELELPALYVDNVTIA